MISNLTSDIDLSGLNLLPPSAQGFITSANLSHLSFPSPGDFDAPLYDIGSAVNNLTVVRNIFLLVNHSMVTVLYTTK